MSIRWINAALAEKHSKNGARLLLFVLADRADDETGVSYYGVEKLMEKTNLSKSALHLAVRELTGLQLLQVEYKKGPKGCNVYQLLLTAQNLDGAKSAPCRIRTQTVQNVDGTVQNLDGDRAESGPNPSGIHQEPREDPKREDKALALSPPPASSAPPASAFHESTVEEICQLYPRKQNPLETKHAIREALRTLLPRFTSSGGQGAAAVEATAAWLRGQITAYAASRKGQPGSGTPHAATWFREGGYDQDFTSSAPGTAAKARGTLEECRAFAEELGLSASDGEAFFNGKEGNGWRNGKNPIRDWRATFRNWQANGWHPTQKARATSFGAVPVPIAPAKAAGELRAVPW